MNGFKVNTALQKITTSSHPKSFLSASHAHAAKPVAPISKNKTNQRQNPKLLAVGQHTGHTKRLPAPSAALPLPSPVFPPPRLHPTQRMQRGARERIPSRSCERGRAAAPCPLASHCAEEHQGWTWPGTSAAHTCSSRKLTRDSVARTQVYPQGC